VIEPKVAVPRKTNPKLILRTKKIFVGGLSSNTNLDDIKKYFEQFAKVKEAMLAYDRLTNRHRGFG
jgi:RNA-binding protein Musashi